jgi:hypothetical protein
MDWEAFSAIGEVIGALFVGVSLLYLAIQLHQSTSTMRMQALGAALGVHVTQIAKTTETAAAAALFRKFVGGGLISLSLDERGMVMCLMLERIVSFNQVINLHKAGLLAGEEFHAMQNTIISILRTKGGREWWGRYKHMTPRGIDAYITAAIESAAITCRPYDEELPWLFTEAPQ